MIRAVIFDMDGVMIDTEHIQSKAFENILSEYGIVAEKNEHGTVHVSGATTTETWDMLKALHGFYADTEELTRKKRDAVMAVLRQGIQPFPGFMTLVDDLRAHDIRLAVATSAQRERAELVLGMLGIGEYFGAIVTAQDVARGKPAPDPYLKAAELLCVPPAECLVLEDAEVGVASAKAAGMKVIAVPNEYTKLMNFSEADMIAESLTDVNYAVVNTL